MHWNMTTVTQIQEAAVQSNVERNCDKMKDDAIAQLSDQLMALTARMRALRGNNNGCNRLGL